MPHTGTSEAKSGAPPSGALPASGGSFVRRDKLMRIEEDVQRLWDKTRPYEVDVCSLRRPRFVDSEPCNGSSVKNKFFCSFPYPYMNGLLHLGHGFTLCKAEFLARYYRLRGKNVLWPFALHCTGMPILACADRLKREIEAKKKEHELQEDKKEDQQEEGGSSDPTKFSSAKSKLVAKTGGLKSQWEIMAALGVPQDEIARFADANYWLDYFPPRCKKNLIRLGVAVDWRRSFITTDRNPFYSAFVRWQFMKLMLIMFLRICLCPLLPSPCGWLRLTLYVTMFIFFPCPCGISFSTFKILQAAGKISFGTRPTVISRRELQACADHDRLSGEGIGPQEYTLIKMRIKTEQMDASHAPHAEFKAAWEKHSSTNEGQSRQIFLVAATLRPETMYGQTNCYVLPEGDAPPLTPKPSKSTFSLADVSGFACMGRSALNMAYQASGGADELPTPHCLHRVSGQALLGLPLAAPLASYDTVFALPMQTISLEKGTGVVTSVPTDSPDDFTTLEYIRSKIEYFNKLYGIKEEWVLPFQPVEIIEVPGLGRQAAPTLCAQLGVSGPKDTQRLQQAKEEAYRRGFYEGVMTVGPFAGRKVQEAKALVREQLLQEGSACVYYEPEKKVVARSGDECVVGLLPQWFISYGEAEWRQQVEDYISGEDFSAFSPQAQHQFAFVLSWLKEWACSRSYGLGTFLPWTVNTDNPVLIESLSDSTIYMAYYTVAYLIQGGDMYGQSVGPLGLKPEDLTEAFFDYIFLLSDTPPEGSAVSVDNLNLLRSEFAYWYPLDLRVSGKDLIFNHLTFCLYCHTAVWPKQQELWPRAFACNGMVLVDSEKMSKSTGNFLTIEESIEKFSADATRIAFADAGDSLDDANFQRETANAAITRLYLLEGLVADFVAGKIELRDGPLSAADELFQNEIGLCVQSAAAAYEAMQNREALKAAFYELTIKRDQYKQLVGDEKMHRDMLRMWIEAQAITLCPIAPHICEYLWSCLLKKENLVVDAAWPQLTYDSALHREYGPLQQRVLSVLQRVPLVQGLQGQVEAPSDFMQIVKDAPELEDLDKNQKKEALAFASYQMRDELKACGRSALELRLPFSEKALLEAHRRFLEVSLELTCQLPQSFLVYTLEFRSSDDPSPLDSTNCRTLAKPGKPSIFFTSV
ncbi:leucyl-tRNA synthetase [Cyclospora cayetanensis]|uniref:leucine--tRNA ligase n=1 Tax=Cyclospora cayetanensis TaxID=88456 RepID=A0A1D3D5F8_9EIME|nr:leucyl-tRNA synthetase [Cyclospora cayetanensis]